MATASSNENARESEGGEGLGSASSQLTDAANNNHKQNSSRQANSAELPRVDAVTQPANHGSFILKRP